jgi:hypothetical protein
MSRPVARVCDVLLGLLGVDLLVLLVSGSRSLLPPWVEVAPAGVLWRAVLIAAVALTRFRLLPGTRRPETGALVLGLLLLPTLVHFHVGGGRINGDGLSYYVFVRSLNEDRDFDLTNEYTHYGMIGRADLAQLTRTGLRRSIYSIGPAIVWTPFFQLGEVTARVAGTLGAEVDLSGYGPDHRNAVALGSLLYGYLGLCLLYGLLRRHFSSGAALGAVLLLWGGSFLYWYMVWQPTYAHAASFGLAVYALWLWDRDRGRRDLWGYAYLGLILGVSMSVRWQNGVLLLLPGLELLERVRATGRGVLRLAERGALLAAGTVVGASSQLMAWKALYDEWLLKDPPHGADFLRLDHPFVLETLFSSRHGLLSWTPVLWLGYLGFVPLLWRRPRLAVPLLPLLAIMTYVNLCSGDWWAGASYSNRRFDSVLPLLALGIATSFELLRRLLARRPQLAVAGIAIPFVLWNVLLAEQARRALLPRDSVVSFTRITRVSTELLSRAVGFPTTWPASWLFAWEQGRPPSQYDRLVGKYLFYRQNNLGGHVAVDTPDPALLGDGWSRLQTRDGGRGRLILGEALFFAPLDVPLDLDLRLRGLATERPGGIRIAVNGREAGRVWIDVVWSEPTLRVPSPFWREGLNRVVLRSAESGLLVGSVSFSKAAAR